MNISNMSNRELEALAQDISVELQERELRVNCEDALNNHCLLYTSPSPRDGLLSRMPSSA